MLHLFKGENAMTLFIKTLAAVAAGTILATSAFAQSAREVRGASPFETIENEPAAKLIVDRPLPGPLAQGQFLAQYRVENVRPERIPSHRASAHQRQRPALVVGGCE
jgi:Family of unknown function (DUF6130)